MLYTRTDTPTGPNAYQIWSSLPGSWAWKVISYRRQCIGSANWFRLPDGYPLIQIFSADLTLHETDLFLYTEPRALGGIDLSDGPSAGP